MERVDGGESVFEMEVGADIFSIFSPHPAMCATSSCHPSSGLISSRWHDITYIVSQYL